MALAEEEDNFWLFLRPDALLSLSLSPDPAQLRPLKPSTPLGPRFPSQSIRDRQSCHAHVFAFAFALATASLFLRRSSSAPHCSVSPVHLMACSDRATELSFCPIVSAAPLSVIGCPLPVPAALRRALPPPAHPQHPSLSRCVSWLPAALPSSGTTLLRISPPWPLLRRPRPCLCPFDVTQLLLTLTAITILITAIIIICACCCSHPSLAHLPSRPDLSQPTCSSVPNRAATHPLVPAQLRSVTSTSSWRAIRGDSHSKTPKAILQR